jgi:NAD(P)-dependent dehydrogenase (short-subunit alcohol dehydrogenase family)
LKNKICIITGATSGIGRATALRLGNFGADLILIGRDEQRGSELVHRLKRARPDGKFQFLKADLSSIAEVRRVAATIRGRCQRIDILINNAGVRNHAFRPSPDGIECTFATNHLGHFLLTLLLIDKLQAAKAARIIHVASGAHSSADGNFESSLRADAYDRKIVYANSKLANILFSYELARRLHGTGVTSNALDPGGVATNLGRNDGLTSWLRHIGYHALKRDLVAPTRGADTILYLATSPDVDSVSGKYFRRNQELRSSSLSYDREVGRRLWQLSLRLGGLDPQAASLPEAFRV